MEKLPELKTSLSNEFKKPKSDRNYELIRNIQSEIQSEKKLLHKEFKKRAKEKDKEEVKLRLSLWSKKNAQYGKYKAEAKKKKAESENAKVVKLQQKNKK